MGILHFIIRGTSYILNKSISKEDAITNLKSTLKDNHTEIPIVCTSVLVNANNEVDNLLISI